MKKVSIAVFVVLALFALVKWYQSSSTTLAISSYTGPYKDGTYTGTSYSNQYGNVQVATIVSGGKITTINFLSAPSDRAHSAELSAYAKPYLQQEAITSQNANVNIVSGATLTSESFQQSLQSALNQAL